MGTLQRIDLPSLLTGDQVVDAYGRRGATAEPAGAEDIGRLSAQAVLSQYEVAAKAVEGMGAEIKDRIAKLEGALVEADADMKLVAEAAKSIREKGSLVYAQIEEASGLSKDIRGACADFRRKVGAEPLT